ncbi:MAG TPA: biopolymer transporter ExbD [Candidatus Limnocylindrales bacterium]|nr:biopolymer transporter ExbD [Candidatus Limnocylindrales bacterium]
MSLKKTSRNSHGTMNELNITPLLDLVFVLLVIFIITTPQLMNNLEMNLPSGKPPVQDNKPKPKINRIVINAQAQITLNDEPVTLAQLKEKLAALKAETPDLAVVVKGSDEVEYQGMVAVLDTLQQLDITKVGLATE